MGHASFLEWVRAECSHSPDGNSNSSPTMIHLAEHPQYLAVRRRAARWNHELLRVRSPLLRYGFSVVCVSIALGLALACRDLNFGSVALPLFNLAIVLTSWHAGVGPSVLAVLLSAACFNYYFSDPIYSFEISLQDLPDFLTFTAWAVTSSWFVAVRRRIEDDLRNARDHLQVELEQNKLRTEEIRKLNRELENRADQLQSSNNELESFAYSVSHDLRAPLRHLVGYSELLQKQAFTLLDEKCRRYTQTILESSKRMGNLIDDLLAFSRIGRAETRKTLVSLEPMVKEVVSEISQEARGRDIAWKINALPVCYGDRSMLRLVVVNLLSNAAKFTNLRPQAIIEIGSVDASKDEVEIFVRDNGAGFDMQYANKLFGVFQRLHRAEEFEGTGIGLAIVQRIVQRHGGKVRAEGAIDQGATFYFTLPKVHHALERTARTP
jgi:signal transduction histidine kinase